MLGQQRVEHSPAAQVAVEGVAQEPTALFLLPYLRACHVGT